MSSSDEEINNLSPNTRMEQRAKELVENLLPSKSRAIYLKAYENFMVWKKEKRVQSFSEGVFLNYFDEISKKYKASTLWSIYSMLKTTIQTKHEIDIKKYINLTSMLSQGYKAKKSKVFTASEIERFLNDAPNEIFLATKVALIFGISGACRGIELSSITLEDVETDTKLQAVNLPKTKTDKDRKFVICGDYLKIVKTYQNLRPSDVPTNRFFLNYQIGKCTRQVIGKNKFAGMPKQIASFLNLPNPDEYTGHCFRRTSATLLADSGANLLTLKRHGGWKSDQVAEGYIEESIKNKQKIAKNITEGINIRPIEPQPSWYEIANASPRPSTSREAASASPTPSTSHEVGNAPINLTSPHQFLSKFSSHRQSSTAMDTSYTNPPSHATETQSPTFTPQLTQLTSTSTNINLPGKTITLHVTNCTNCTFKFS